jgi:phage I-like protein
MKPNTDLETLAALSNEFALDADWLKVPYGDHPHALGLQRLDRAAAEELAANFRGFGARLGRLFGGAPIYIGHPDDPRLANQFPDRKAYGWIMAIEARDDGLYLQPKWGAAGQDLLANAHYKWFSPFWGCRNDGLENGRAILRPVRLVSIGLTNTPNIEGIPPLANEDATQPTPKGEPPVNRTDLIKALGLPENADDPAILAAIKAVQDELAALKAKAAESESARQDAANEKTARAAAESALANEKSARIAERKARIELLLDNAQAAGKFTPAQRPQWAADLDKDFEGKSAELANAKPVLNTRSATDALGARNAAAQSARDATLRRDKVLMLVNERIAKTGEAYEQAFAAIRKEHAALFADMRTPSKS